ncbi:MAG: dUTP diphosphatase [Pseudanabaena sp.]|jgi:dUTP pyrophosphatase|uniref:dUTP diphosphatase n=1 Tax=Pseudanabaena mucicola TaxID=71190 RepID=UPI002578F01A|nr:dUTP diphosphatase [Pseudanabaena mucicola]MCA6572711.1 dUTP diphosphatase [Pseudanabaena sp. M53BS1SP1A06MG]MCA6583905.1 dUTP diphosphatase [Pseudanabaena sp. M34BS1SP1A06MG]MCA6592457.1 dUTP diphosphatase [Pseudanabaena sp. M38BS1SP1A06MG]MCA6597508.1 dUTP diphosphatase [Pseudanabaena sp. M046S1SP1A06QC]MCA6600150.1 dUTP diphosphatase [Pseudanabaena sp. M57BS1SP1A06MG]
MQTVEIKFNKLHPDAQIPSYAHVGDAGADVYSVAEVTLQPSDRAAIPTGLAVDIPLGYEIQVRPKSGLALKHGITVLNSPGTVDAGYRGEIQVIVINLGKEVYTFAKGQKIAQLVLKSVIQAQFIEGELGTSDRGDGGFGSTGIT